VNGPYNGQAGTSISFTSQGSYDPDGSIVEYRWRFGDGTPESTTQISTHTYSTSGSFTVTLTVTDNQGAINMNTALCTISPVTDGQVPNDGSAFNILGNIGNWVGSLFGNVGNFLSSLSIQTIMYIVSIGGGTIAIYSFIIGSKREKRRQEVLFESFRERIDEVYKRFKMNSRECEAELIKLKGEIIVEFKDKKIEPSYYDFLEKRIKEYMDEIKEQINKEK
jgi:hypothetical protein